MNWLFDAEKPLMRGLSTVADLMILNFLALLCSLPVITAGPSFTALCSVSMRVVRGEEGSLVKDFWKAFFRNLKRSTLFWLLLLLCCGVLYFDYLAATVYIPVMRYGIAALGILLLAISLYVFVLLARYDNSLLATIKNALLLAIGYFPKTLAMTAFAVCFWTLAFGFLRYGAPILLLFGLSLPCYVCCILMNPILLELENNKG